jgi:hypothetical protein
VRGEGGEGRVHVVRRMHVLLRVLSCVPSLALSRAPLTSISHSPTSHNNLSFTPTDLDLSCSDHGAQRIELTASDALLLSSVLSRNRTVLRARFSGAYSSSSVYKVVVVVVHTAEALTSILPYATPHVPYPIPHATTHDPHAIWMDRHTPRHAKKAKPTWIWGQASGK